jgi:serine phosphatase RsbU (regulator of sigma subunit)/CBS domain-containing protein
MQPAPAVTVRQVMVADPVLAAPGEPVQAVLRKMTRHGIGAVLVAEDGRVVGIFTERDLLRRASEAPPGWRQRPVADWMTPAPPAVSPDHGWEETVALMERHHVRHLPVVEAGRIVGVVTARSLIAHRTEHLNRLVGARTAELRGANELLLAREGERRHTLEVAGRLQKRLLLPGAPPDWPEIAWGLHYAPLDSLGGDYYDFFQPDPEHLGVLIADASGHSLPAAMVAIMARLAFAEAVRGTARPGEVLAAMNRRLQGLSDQRFVTAFFGVLHRPTRRFTFASAGHPCPLHFAPGRPDCRPLEANGFMLGILPEAVYAEGNLELAPGDRLCFFTDGLLEVRDPAGEPFGPERLERYLLDHRHEPVKTVTQELIGHLNEFRGGQPANDDVTVLIASGGG